MSFRPPLSRLPTKPFPLDGCPMFADFRVHGLNTTFFQCFHHRSTPTYRKRKRRASPSFSTHVRESPRTWGTRPGGKAGEETRDLSHHQRMTPPLGSPSRVHSSVVERLS